MPAVIPWWKVSLCLDLLARGVSAVRVAERVGVARTSVNRFARLAGMELVYGSRGGMTGPRVPDTALMESGGGVRARGRAYSRLSFEQRVILQTVREIDPTISLRQIAQRLGVSASTVSRELKRGAFMHAGKTYYQASNAHRRALQDRDRYTPAKLDNPALRQGVVERLNQRFSPQQVAGELALMFPTNPEMTVSHETIYQALYVQSKGSLRHELSVEKALRSGRTVRKKRSDLPRRSNRPWLEGAMFRDQPSEKFGREVPGNWEGDLVVGPENSGLVTLVERQSRYTLIGRLPGTRDSDTVIDVLKAMILTLPEKASTNAITWDQGQEMAHHAQFTIDTGCKVYFCDPHSPWQRPSNENTNGLIRDFYPKGTNFNDISDEDIANTEHLINIRPRRMHDYLSATVKLEQQIQANRVALAP